jgi:hypothetical protein
MRRPPTVAQGLALPIIIAFSTGLVLLLATSFIGAPAVLILALGLLLTHTYYTKFRGRPNSSRFSSRL